MTSIHVGNHHSPLLKPAPQEGVSLAETYLVLGEEPGDVGRGVGSGRRRRREEGGEEDVGRTGDLHEHRCLSEGSEEEGVGLGDEDSESTNERAKRAIRGRRDASTLELIFSSRDLLTEVRWSRSLWTFREPLKQREEDRFSALDF